MPSVSDLSFDSLFSVEIHGTTPPAVVNIELTEQHRSLSERYFWGDEHLLGVLKAASSFR